MRMQVKHHVTVGPGGSIEICDPSLPNGSRAEVVVQIETQEPDSARRLQLLDELQKSMNLTHEQADAWIADVRAERDAWPLPR